MARRPKRQDETDKLLQAFVRLPKQSQLLIVVVLLAFALIVGGVWLYQHQRQQAASTPPPVVTPTPKVELPATLPTTEPVRPKLIQPVSPQMPLGNPSGATADVANRDNFLLLKPYFALSYNNTRGTPNWVSWTVTAKDIEGSSARKQTFDPDMTLPGGFKVIQHRDYTNSGFDRGHMCPHSDRDASNETSWATFVMTNIIPQAPDVNQKAWKQLEDYGRRLVGRGNTLCVIAGAFGEGGEGKNGPANVIANGRVTVPAWCWKVIVVAKPVAGESVPGIDAGSRVIAILMPNKQGMGEDWKPYLCTPADIEQKTGYRFFDTLSPEIAAALRAKKDTGGSR
ncbi:MAG: DNA/RNA non-specific endonuclease [Tepidisphaeraceae bacterium]